MTSIVRAGGIVPIDTEVSADVRAGVVSARRYAHPTLPGKTIVRVVPDVMAPGVDVEMETLGFSRGHVSDSLGKARFRALGFPGWALVNDPKRARFALEVMKNFKRAAKQIRSKPGNARDAFIEIGRRLSRSVPHFLPSFWEEAGRRFIAEDSTTFAAQCFEKARQAEKEHALEVDEDVRSAVYLEFALAGAIAAKSLAGYAKELEEAYGAAAAYPRYVELATRRVLGGMPPWTGLAKELRALAKGAQRDLAAEDEAFVAAVIDAPAIARAPGDLWTTYEPAILRLAKRSPALRRRLRHLFPTSTSGVKDFHRWWFDLLIEAGALLGLWDETVGAAEAEPADATAEWLGKAIRFTRAAPALLALLPKLAPRLAREQKPVDVQYSPGRGNFLALDFAETLLAHGVSVAEPRYWSTFSLSEPFTCDPVHVQADPALGPRLLLAVEAALGTAELEVASAGKKGLALARRAWLEREVARLSGGGLYDLAIACARLEAKVRPALWAEHPDLVAAVAKTDVAAVLARTLRGGVFAEWTWPVYEELFAREDKDLLVEGAWPFPVFRTKTTAFVLGADKLLLEHDLVVPPKATVSRCLYVDGDLLVLLAVPGVGQRAYWASSPNEVFEMEGYFYMHDLPISAALPGGGISYGDRAFHRGDRALKLGAGVAFDGATVWTATREDGRLKLREVDVETGTKGRASWPAFVATAAAESTDALRLLQVSLAPAPEGVTASPLGQKDGLVGHYHRGPFGYNVTGLQEVVTVTGARWAKTGLERPVALVTWPGDSAARAAFHRRSQRPDAQHRGVEIQVEDPSGAVVTALGPDPAYGAGWPRSKAPHILLWHFLRPRDEEGSRALRAVSAELAKELIDDPASLSAKLPAVKAKALAEGVAALVTLAIKARADLAKLAEATTSGVAAEPGADAPVLDSALIAALGAFVEARYSQETVSTEILARSDEVRGLGERRASESWTTWDRLVGRLRGVALFAMLPGTPAEHRRTVAQLLRVFAQTVFADGTLHQRWLAGKIAPTSPLKPDAARSWVARHAGSTYVVRTIYGLNASPDGWTVTVLELRADDAFVAPPGLTVTHEEKIPFTDERAYLARFAEVVTEGPPAWDPAAAEAFAAESGLTRAEATLLLAGMPNMNTYAADFLGKELRETLGLKTSEARMARDSLRGLPKEKLLELFTLGAPEDPKDLARPWKESGLAGRLGRAYGQVFGARVVVREELVTACARELAPPLPPATLLTAVAAEAEPSFFARPPATLDHAFKWQQKPPSDMLSPAALTSVVGLVAWLYLTLPAGDPYRDAIPRLVAATERVLADPELLLPLRLISVDDAQRPALGVLLGAVEGKATSVNLNQDVSERAVDSGAIVAASFRDGRQAAFLFRPARLPPDDPVARAIASSPLPSWGLGTGAAWHAIALLRSDGLRAIALRVASRALPAGAYEANPSASMPDLVAKVAKSKKLSDEAACHYLQLLGLLEPTSRSVQTWNGWKPAQYKKTCEELLAKKLVVVGKRERAGREIFLPGAWEKGKDKNLPTEAWKAPLYAIDAPTPRALPLRPLADIWTDAWKRIEVGDVPKLEEV